MNTDPNGLDSLYVGRLNNLKTELSDVSSQINDVMRNTSDKNQAHIECSILIGKQLKIKKEIEELENKLRESGRKIGIILSMFFNKYLASEFSKIGVSYLKGKINYEECISQLNCIKKKESDFPNIICKVTSNLRNNNVDFFPCEFLETFLNEIIITPLPKKKFDGLLNNLCEKFRKNGFKVKFSERTELKKQLMELSPEERRSIMESI